MRHAHLTSPPVKLNYLLSENVLRPTPDRAIPQPKRQRQKMGKDVEKAAPVPATAISRLEMINRKRRPNLSFEHSIRMSFTFLKILHKKINKSKTNENCQKTVTCLQDFPRQGIPQEHLPCRRFGSSASKSADRTPNPTEHTI